MSYASRYKLDVLGANADEAGVELEDIAGFDMLEDCWSWPEQDECMARLTKRFPRAVFVLHREGEEAGDLARTYYRHGEEPVEARPRIVWPEPPHWART